MTFSYVTSNMQSTRRGHTATALADGTVLIAGGFQDTHGDVILSSGELFTPAAPGSPATAGTFALTSSNLPTQMALQQAVVPASGSVLLTGGFAGSNSAAAYTYPVITGNVNPKYVVLGVVYSPPGKGSSVSYSGTTALGTGTSLDASLTTGKTITASVGVSFNAPVKGSLSGTLTQNWTSESDSSSSYTVNKSSTYGISAAGPLASNAGVDHGFDYVLVWLNPKASFTVGSVESNLLWGGYQYDTNDSNVYNDMDVVQIYVDCLQNYYSTQSYCTDNNYRTARSWDPILGALTADDYAEILKRDPFVANPNYDPGNDPNYRFTSASSINYTPAPPGSGVSCYNGGVTYGSVSTAAQAGTDTYSVSSSVDASIMAAITADFKASDTTTISSKWSSTTTNSIGKQAGYNICSPVATDNYTGPTGYDVWRDNIYGTFMFYAPNTTPSSPGTISLSPSPLNFGTTPVGSASTPLQVTLTYTSGPNETSNQVPLVLQSPAVVFSDPAFSLQGDNCSGATLQSVGAVCTFSVVFSPTTAEYGTSLPRAVSAMLYATGSTNGIVQAEDVLSATAVPVGTPSKGSSSLSGVDRKVEIYEYSCRCYIPIYDVGQVQLTINGNTVNVSYGPNSSASSLAASLATAVNQASGMSVTASASGSAISLTSNTAGASVNYPLSATSYTQATAYFSGTSFPISVSGPTMTGGTD